MIISSEIKSRYNFKGGLSKKMKADINNVIPRRIEQSLASKNINANFNNNNVIAWCCSKVVELLRIYNLSQLLPSNIYVMDLSALECSNTNVYAFTNFLPSKIVKNSNEIIPSFSVIFNKNINWENIDELSDIEFHLAKNTVTDYFLEPFIHEFGHVAHEKNLVKKRGVNGALDSLINLTKDSTIDLYKTKCNGVFDNLCNCAKQSPLELVACDMSRRIINNIDRNKMELVNNPLVKSPYSNFFGIINKIFKDKNLQEVVINNFYNGNIEILSKI